MRAMALQSARFLLLCAIGFCMCVPFLWMTGTSFKPRKEADGIHIVPHQPTLKNYPVVLDLAPDPITGEKLDLRFGRWYFNSFFVTLGITLLQVLTSAMAAYAFARIPWRGRDTVFLLYLATIMVPSVILTVPNFQVMVALGFTDTYHGLIVPAAFSAFGTFLLRQFMLSIPREMDEAAFIDGASRWRVFWDVILPLTRPGLVALAIITFLGNYQSLFWPLIMLNDAQYYTLPVGMLSFSTLYGTQTEFMMAGTVMAIAPLVVAFAMFQKFLVKGIQLGSVKG